MLDRRRRASLDEARGAREVRHAARSRSRTGWPWWGTRGRLSRAAALGREVAATRPRALPPAGGHSRRPAAWEVAVRGAAALAESLRTAREEAMLFAGWPRCAPTSRSGDPRGPALARIPPRRARGGVRGDRGDGDREADAPLARGRLESPPRAVPWAIIGCDGTDLLSVEGRLRDLGFPGVGLRPVPRARACRGRRRASWSTSPPTTSS